MNRVFGIREKLTASSYGDYIPIGVEGRHAVMGTGLALEEEFSVGGNGTVSITTATNGDTQISQKDNDENDAEYKVTNTIISETKPDATEYPIDDKLPTGIDLTGATYIIQNTERGTRKIKKVIVITSDDNIYNIIINKEGDD